MIEKQGADTARREAERREQERLDKERRDREAREATLLAIKPSPFPTKKVVSYLTLGVGAIVIGFGARTGLSALDKKSEAAMRRSERARTAGARPRKLTAWH